MAVATATACNAAARPAKLSAPAAILTAAPTRADWIAFAKTLTGPLFLPGTWQYNSSKLIFDTRYDNSTPAAVAQVAGQGDIQKCMTFAGRYGLQVSPRSGGHSYVGASAANGTLVLDTRHYAWITYNADTTVSVFSGANLYDVHRTVIAHGRDVPTGTCPTVGAAGLTLGGGLGIDSRKYGLTCDQLVSATVVLADGSALRVSSTAHSDIFWALRGGGGGNVAFVTAMVLRTHAATGRGVFQLTFPSSWASTALTRWSAWMRARTTDWWSNFHIDSLANGAIQVSVVGATPVGQERTAAASLISAIGVGATSAHYYELSALGAVQWFGGGTTSPRQPFTAGSDILPSLSSAAASRVIGAVAARSRAGGAGAAVVDPLDGAIGAPSASATAFPWRDHAASVQWYVGGTGYSSATAWINQAHSMLGSYSAGGYVNYLEAGLPASRYYAGNFSRLQQLRRTYDPARRLHSGASF